ncbi:hypothetical protein D3C83_31540 [compost metagenome]
MQSLQMRWPVAAAIGLSTAMMASAASGSPRAFTRWNSEIFSSSGQPARGTLNTVFLNPVAGAFSFRPVEQESLPCSWHQMQ